MPDQAHDTPSKSIAKEAAVAPAPAGKNTDKFKRSKTPARIVGVSVENGKTRILISVGTNQDVAVGSKGRLMIGSQAPFTVDRVHGETACSAPIDESVESLQEISMRHVWIFPRTTNKS